MDNYSKMMEIMEQWEPPKYPEVKLSEKKYVIISGPYKGYIGRVNENDILYGRSQYVVFYPDKPQPYRIYLYWDMLAAADE